MKPRVLLLSVLALFVGLSFSCKSGTDANYWPTKEWRIASPQKVGMDATMLEQIIPHIQGSFPRVSSLIATRYGKIVLEKYFEGDKDTPRSAHSITKSVISALLGILIKQGKIEGIDQKLVDFFPANDIIRRDPLAMKITLRHLLTMSDGIQSAGNMIEYYFSDPKYSKPLKSDPGVQFHYNNLSAQILSMIITKATTSRASDLAIENLFQPLGITTVSWSELQGYSNGAYGLLLSSRDLAKIGYLFLKKGIWDNRQLIPKEWVTDSTVKQIATGESSDYFKEYGYYWWVHDSGTSHRYYAIGWGNQIIYIVPALDLLAVITTRETKDGGEPECLALIDKYILGSIQK